MKSLRTTAVTALVALNVTSVAHASAQAPHTHLHAHGGLAEGAEEASEVGRWSSPF